jgi:adenine deaminase
VFGHKGLKFFLEESKSVKGDIYFALPSCVPATNIEQANVTFTSQDLKQYIDSPQIISLGELMDANSVITGKEET